MSAITRLVWIYFTATPLSRWLAALGLVMMAAGIAGYLYYPVWTFGTGRSDFSLAYQALVTGGPWYGLLLLYFATASLPGVVERLLLGRGVYVLPSGRLCLLLSVLATAASISLLMATGTFLFFVSYPAEFRPEDIFWRAWLVTFSNVGLMYTALWIVSKARGIWLLIGSLVIAIAMVVPLGAIGRPSGVSPMTAAGLVLWAAFAALVLCGGRFRHNGTSAVATLVRRARVLVPPASYAAGTELDLLLGTTRPSVVAIGQAVPLVFAAWLIPDLGASLFFLTMFTAIQGAITSTAAARSRVLWLKLGWTRAEIFQRVEAAYWRYNAYPLGVLLLLFIGFGAYHELSTAVIALGVPLLVLGSLVSSYLGLMMMRGLRWLEIVLGIGTMSLLIRASLVTLDAEARMALAIEQTPMALAIELEVVLAALALTFRFWAKKRWLNLDWLVCRDAALTRGAG
jgi:hypothetical protein